MSASLAATIENAFDAATSAALSHHYAENDRGDCGSAWVVLTARKGRKAILAEIATQFPGVRTHKHHGGGVAITVCGNLRNQSRAIYEAACDAFVGVFEKAGIEAHTYSYAD